MSTTSWQPSTTYQKVAEANRQYYAQTAAMYEATETCVTDPLLQRGLESDLDRAQLRTRTFRSSVYATASLRESWRNFRSGTVGIIARASPATARQSRKPE